MVDRKIIEDIISKSILSKCYRNKIPLSGGKYQIRLNTNVRNRINEFSDKIKGSNKEHLLILDNKGDIIFEKEGNTDGVSISLSDEENEFLNNLKTVKVDNHVKKGDYIVIHNHPVHDADSLDSEESYRSILPPCFSHSDVLTFRSQDFCKTSIVISSDNESMMLLSKTEDYYNSFIDRGPYSESEFMGNVFGNPFRLPDAYFNYIDKLYDNTKQVINDDVDSSILRRIIDKGYSTPNDILGEYEKIAMSNIGSFEEDLVDVRSFFNDNGIELSIERV